MGPLALPLRPEADELLSSWLRRVALANAPALHTFCNTYWRGVQLWNRDLDCSAPSVVWQNLAQGTGTAIQAARNTTMQGFEGVLVEKIRVTGSTDLILAAGIYHRIRRNHGQQWCPLCLSADVEPYYRRRWRLAIASTCPRHGIVLADGCHECGAPAMPHRGADPYCHHCYADRRDHPGKVADSWALQFEYRLTRLLDPDEVPQTRLEEMHPLAFYGLVRHVFSAVAQGERSQGLRDEIARHWGGDPAPAVGHQLEYMRADDRHRMIGLVARVMRGWPWLFIAHCADAGVWKSWAFGDRRDGKAVFAYADTLERYLTYQP
jgi:hypothetical protein